MQVRPHVGADHPAFRADHAWPELAHQEVARVLIDVEDHLVPTAVAHDVGRKHSRSPPMATSFEWQTASQIV
jgi:hypothetical protein